MIETGQFRTSNSTPTSSVELSQLPDCAGSESQLVQVWFGVHIVCAYRGETDAAQRYAHAMARRFAGLKVTVNPPSTGSNGGISPMPPLPNERLWELIP